MISVLIATFVTTLTRFVVVFGASGTAKVSNEAGKQMTTLTYWSLRIRQ